MRVNQWVMLPAVHGGAVSLDMTELSVTIDLTGFTGFIGLVLGFSRFSLGLTVRQLQFLWNLPFLPPINGIKCPQVCYLSIILWIAMTSVRYCVNIISFPLRNS